jgi:hypothetical protein
MKKIISLLFITFLIQALYSNPIIVPYFYIEKFYFDENGKWKIEVNTPGKLTEVKVSSSSGWAFLRNLKIMKSIFTISNDSLDSNLKINQEGDSITVTAIFINRENLYDTISENIVFGNYKNSVIPKPINGQFIQRYGFYESYFCISDSEGNTEGTLHGHIYDKNNNLITKGHFCLSSYVFEVHCSGNGFKFRPGCDIYNDGTYSATLPCLRFNIDTIASCKKDSCGPDPAYRYYIKTGNAHITPINFTITPNSSINMDIHLLSDFTSLKKDESSDFNLFKIYPNPINSINFRYEINVPVTSTNCSLNLFSITGQLIKIYSIKNNYGDLILPENIKNGSYFIQLQLNQKKLAGIKLLVDRQ